jgi:hypothetical protein
LRSRWRPIVLIREAIYQTVTADLAIGSAAKQLNRTFDPHEYLITLYNNGVTVIAVIRSFSDKDTEGVF